MKIKLIDNIAQWKQFWSMRWIIATTIFGTITATYITLPPDWLPEISKGIKVSLALGTMFSAAGAGVSRLIKQVSLETPPPEVVKNPENVSEPKTPA